MIPKGNKYGHSDSIIRSSRIVCGEYSIRPYVGGFAPRPHLLCLSPAGAIWGAYAIRPYRQGWRLVFLSPFLSLMKEKEAKENQGIGDACQVACIRPNFVGGRSRLDLLLPSFLLSREEKKGRFLRERRDLCQVARDNHASEKSTRQTSLPSAEGLSWMKEMEAKENQGIRDACQVVRVLQTKQRGSC